MHKTTPRMTLFLKPADHYFLFSAWGVSTFRSETEVEEVALFVLREALDEIRFSRVMVLST